MAGTSGVNREVYAPFCGRLVVKFHRPTRHSGLLYTKSMGIHAETLRRTTSEGFPCYG